jgi:hypothetical protein
MSASLSTRCRHGLILVISLCLPAILFFCVRAEMRLARDRIVVSSNLREIVQSVLIHAQDHDGQLPRAKNIWDYAGQLAGSAGLDSTAMWQSRTDPAQEDKPINLPVLLPQQPSQSRRVDPAFLHTKPCFAIPVAELTTKMPLTTPLIWTRGLRHNGTWAEHSPYGTDGGHITFLGGDIHYYHNLSAEGGQLLRFDGKGKTANILEALPPGTQIAEYIPTPAEQEKFALINWLRSGVRKATTLWSGCLFFVVIIVTPAFGFSTYSQRFSTPCLIVTTVFLVLLACSLAFV